MKDILLDNGGDIAINEDGDIVLEDSVKQKVMIRLNWLDGEWKWDTEEGLPYLSELMGVKNPDTDHFESLVREKIFEVTEITEVDDVSLTYDRKTRKAILNFKALTDTETIKEEVRIDGLRSD